MPNESDSVTPSSSTSHPASARSVDSESLEMDEFDAIDATSTQSLPSERVELVGEKRWLVEKAERQEITAKFGRFIKPGEDVCWTYCWDMARCDCKWTNRYSGVHVLPVARREGRDRCLQCGKSWSPPGLGERVGGRVRKKKPRAS
jgi:hypothetical protein